MEVGYGRLDDMLPTNNGKAIVRIQWSPTGFVRVRHGDGLWRQARCPKAIDAIPMGESLLNSKNPNCGDL
jgi:hypothetical protein